MIKVDQDALRERNGRATPRMGRRRVRMSAFLFAALVPLAANAQPAAPTGFAATAGDEKAVLTWSKTSNADVYRYDFRFRTGNARNYGAWARVPGAGANTVRHTVSGLANGTRYFFELRAFDNDGFGAAASASTLLAESPSSAVEVPDAGLRERIGQTLGLASGAAVTQGDLARLRELQASASGIVDLAGLEFAINVEKLRLSVNEIADLSPLAGLATLTYLTLRDNNIADLSPLAGLTALTTLALPQNELTDVSPLAGLTALTLLFLYGNELTDVSPLAGMAALEYLHLDGNNIADLSPLAGLKSLTKLEADGNEIADISPLAGLTALTLLSLYDNEIADVSPLAGLAALTYLHLSDNEIADVSPLAGLTALTYLHLSNNEIVDVSPLSRLASLATLNLWNNEIADVSPLAGLTALMLLALHSNSISDVSVLSGLTALTDLRLDGNAISDVSTLSGLTALVVLSLSDNAISDVSPLSGLTSLTALYLFNNEIVDVSPLSGLASLTDLRLDGNAVSDVAPLGGLQRLSFLTLGGNAVVDISPLLGSGLPGAESYVDLRGNPLAEGQADHILTLRESGTAVEYDDGDHHVPLFPSAAMAESSTTGFVRVINHSDEAGSVSIEAVDETGEKRGTVTLAMGTGQARHFNAEDLEQGSAAKGLRGIGEGVGDWRLVLRSELDIEVLGYARAPDGFVTSLHDLAPEVHAASVVPTFNPGSNRRQASLLRVTNPTASERRTWVTAWDDAGSSRSSVLVTPAGRTLDLTAAQLEAGREAGEDGAGFAGIGDGTGKWRLRVNAPGQRLMSFLQSPAGHLTNISTGTASLWNERGYFSWERGGRYRVPLFLAASSDIQGFLRIINLQLASAAVTLRTYDGAGVAREPAMLTLRGREVLHFNSDDLEQGSAAKGLPGIGAGVGDWHLEVSADRRFEVLAYARTADGFVTSLHDIAPRAEDGSLWIPFFNPGSNRSQASRLRLVNWGTTAAEATITGIDDAGESPGGTVRASVPARSARDYMSWELETGEGAGLSGALGDGEGKWRLRVSAPVEVEAMSLLGLPTGHVTNLSTTPRHPRQYGRSAAE